MDNMASSLLALLDDIATVLDDVALMTKLAVKKTAGVLGDDLALNAQQVAGVNANRELALVWAVAKGSAVNKLILVPAALAISVVAPAAVTPLLMLGGAYLCYEGFEKIAHKLLNPHEPAHSPIALPDGVDLLAFEKEKVRGAVRTDFILSAEIVVISLGTVAAAPFAHKVAVMIAISTIMTAGVYGLVAAIVKLDDAGLHLAGKTGALRQACGRGILAAAPWMMKALSVIGTAAMFLVGGGIIAHGLPGMSGFAHGTGFFAAALRDGATGLIAGALILAATTITRKLFKS